MTGLLQGLVPFAAPSTGRADRRLVRASLQSKRTNIFGLQEPRVSVTPGRQNPPQHRCADKPQGHNARYKGRDGTQKRNHANVDARLRIPEDHCFKDIHSFAACSAFSQHSIRPFRGQIFRRIGANP